MSNGLRLNSGLLKQLEQFHNSSIKLIISEIVKEELLSQLRDKAKKAQDKMIIAVKEAKDYLLVNNQVLEDIEKEIFDSHKPQEIALKKFRQFQEITSLYIIEAQDHVKIHDLIQMYFNSEAPFQATGKKKCEFPDAIALMSLEALAKNSETKILVVSSDNDWKNFCQKSENLEIIDNLANALSLFQDVEANYICKCLSEKYKKGKLNQVKEAISKLLDEQIYNFYFAPYVEASYCYYEWDGFMDISLNGFEFKLFEHPNIIFEPINFDSHNNIVTLIVESKLSVNIQAECSFIFEEYERVDYTYSFCGKTTKNIQTNLDINVLISFSISSINDLGITEENFKITEIELENTKETYDIYFDYIEPNWSDD